MVYLVDVPTKPAGPIRFRRDLESRAWPVVEIDLRMLFREWPMLSPAYQAEVQEISEWSREKLEGMEHLLLGDRPVNMPRLQSANLVSFPWFDLRRYSRRRWTTVRFVNGRNRMCWMHANGVLRVPLQIQARYADTLVKSYKGRVLWP